MKNRGEPPQSQNPDLERPSYEALDFDGLQRQAHYRVIAYREDILHILDRREAAAIIYHILSRWLEKRRGEVLSELDGRLRAGQPLLTQEEVEDRMWIYMSYNAFVRESGGAIGYNTVTRTLEYLLHKRVVERRVNCNPHFREYEYRINTPVVRVLLKGLPAFPSYIAKGAKGREGSPVLESRGTPPCPPGADAHSQTGLGDHHMGLGCHHMGPTTTPRGATSQKKTQDSSQHKTQQQQSAHVPTPPPEMAASACSLLTELSSEEIALILAHRQAANRTMPPSVEQRLPEVVVPINPYVKPQGKQAAIDEQESEHAPQACPLPDAELSEEGVVHLWEELRRASYDQEERQAQLKAARMLLSVPLPVPLTLDLLQQIYATFLDRFWKQRYGELHLTHLIGTESSTGQKRIVRWVHRLLAHKEDGPPAVRTVGRLDPHPWNQISPPREMGKPQVIPDHHTHQDGSLGGFGRFKRGEHPDDDLEAVVKRLQAKGVLPRFEEGPVKMYV